MSCAKALEQGLAHHAFNLENDHGYSVRGDPSRTCHGAASLRGSATATEDPALISNSKRAASELQASTHCRNR
jgi:hypothetical protein